MATLRVSPGNVPEGGTIRLILTEVTVNDKEDQTFTVHIHDDHGTTQPDIAGSPIILTVPAGSAEVSHDLATSGLAIGSYTVQLAENGSQTRFAVGSSTITTRTFLQRASSVATTDQALWAAIRNRTNAVSFDRYASFLEHVFSPEGARSFNFPFDGHKIPGLSTDTCPPLNIHGPYAYAVLKFATQVFLTLEAGVAIREHDWGGPELLDSRNEENERYRLNDPTATYGMLNGRLLQYLGTQSNQQALPYLDRIIRALLAVTRDEPVEEVLPYLDGVLQRRFSCPSLIELIWSYWHEEGMLAQTMSAIAMRFQNQRSAPYDPLAELELDPLRPLNNLLWGYIQDEHNRLTVPRRDSEYDHHYGMRLLGRAVPKLRSADSRSKFIEAFHNLLYRTAVFYREDSDTTVIADAFPLLNALKDVHLLLAEGAHNQYGDLPWTARAEMLTQQWLLARPEMREFLRGRHMVPYQESWMGAVDAMKKLQGWTDTTITHFHELAVDGERLLLSIRFGDWSELDNIEEQARNWARYWKPEIQRYLYGYLAATGVDLMADVTDNREAATRYLQPSMLLQRRLSAQVRQPALAAPRGAGTVTVGAPAYAQLPRAGRTLALRHEKGE